MAGRHTSSLSAAYRPSRASSCPTAQLAVLNGRAASAERASRDDDRPVSYSSRGYAHSGAQPGSPIIAVRCDVIPLATPLACLLEGICAGRGGVLLDELQTRILVIPRIGILDDAEDSVVEAGAAVDDQDVLAGVVGILVAVAHLERQQRALLRLRRLLRSTRRERRCLRDRERTQPVAGYPLVNSAVALRHEVAAKTEAALRNQILDQSQTLTESTEQKHRVVVTTVEERLRGLLPGAPMPACTFCV
jgi:hypothetical protein